MDASEKSIPVAERSDVEENELSATGSENELKKAANGTILSPQPSDDPKDPLVGSSLEFHLRLFLNSILQNWSQSKKIGILTALSVTSAAAIGSPLAGLLALTPQAKAYDKTVSQISYGVSLSFRAGHPDDHWTDSPRSDRHPLP